MADIQHALLPFRPKPQPDELLSSWVVALAAANIRKLHPFSKLLFPHFRNLWGLDFDVHAQEEDFVVLSRLTGVPSDQISQTTLRAYEGVLFEEIYEHGPIRGVLRIRKHGRSRTGRGQQYCPQCLANDDRPYFRKTWRLALSVLCTVHGTWLRDGCPWCDAPISFHEGDYGQQMPSQLSRVTRCPQCNGRLTELPEEAPHEPPAALFDFQARILNAIHHGFSIELPGGGVNSVPLFDGLMRLLSVLTSVGHAAILREYLLQSSGALALDVSRLAEKGSFEDLRTGDRATLLLCLEELLSNWPEQFLQACKACGLSSSYFQRQRVPLPYWLASEVRWGLFDEYYAPNSEERAAVRAYLEARGEKPTSNAIKRLLGVAFRPLIEGDPLVRSKHTWNPRGPRH